MGALPAGAACLLQPLPRPQVPGQARYARSSVTPRPAGPGPSRARTRVLGTQRALTCCRALRRGMHLHVSLASCSLGACAGWAAAHGRPCHPAACWPLLLLSRGGTRGGQIAVPRAQEAPPPHHDLKLITQALSHPVRATMETEGTGVTGFTVLPQPPSDDLTSYKA